MCATVTTLQDDSCSSVTETCCTSRGPQSLFVMSWTSTSACNLNRFTDPWKRLPSASQITENILVTGCDYRGGKKTHLFLSEWQAGLLFTKLETQYKTHFLKSTRKCKWKIQPSLWFPVPEVCFQLKHIWGRRVKGNEHFLLTWKVYFCYSKLLLACPIILRLVTLLYKSRSVERIHYTGICGFLSVPLHRCSTEVWPKVNWRWGVDGVV